MQKRAITNTKGRSGTGWTSVLKLLGIDDSSICISHGSNSVTIQRRRLIFNFALRFLHPAFSFVLRFHSRCDPFYAGHRIRNKENTDKCMNPKSCANKHGS